MIKLIVGLGNPGMQYADTRHNLGRANVEALADRFNITWKSWHGHKLTEYRMPKTEDRIWLFLAETFMNLSGGPIAELVRFYKFRPEEILIAHDELDLPLGRVELCQGGGAAGHHGLESIIDALGESNFWRLRLGIGRPPQGIGDRERGTELISQFVLSRFTSPEESVVTQVIDAAVKLLVESTNNKSISQSKNILIRRFP